MEAQVPGGPMVNQTAENEQQIPGGQMLNDNTAPATQDTLMGQACL